MANRKKLEKAERAAEKAADGGADATRAADRHRGVSTQLWASREERESWERAAKAAGMKLSVWMRDALRLMATIEEKGRAVEEQRRELVEELLGGVARKREGWPELGV